jgi:hypothetical protein
MQADGEDLLPAMTRFENLLNQVYPAANEANAAIRIDMLKTAIISFLLDKIAIPLLADIRKSAKFLHHLTYEDICKRAYNAE